LKNFTRNKPIRIEGGRRTMRVQTFLEKTEKEPYGEGSLYERMIPETRKSDDKRLAKKKNSSDYYFNRKGRARPDEEVICR